MKLEHFSGTLIDSGIQINTFKNIFTKQLKQVVKTFMIMLLNKTFFFIKNTKIVGEKIYFRVGLQK